MKTRNTFLLSQKNLILGFFLVLFSLTGLISASAQLVTVPAANTNNGSVNDPLGTWYGFERSTMIYTSAQIGTTGNINSVGFFVNSVSTPGNAVNVRIYMKMRTTLMTANTTYATEITGATLVYGPVTIPSASFVANTWVTIPLTTPFNYTGGTNNLQVIVETNATGGGNELSTGKQFRYTTQPANTSYQSWNTDNTAPTGNGTRSANRPNIQLNFQSLTPCSGTPAPGNTISSSATTTPNGTVNLSLQNATTGTGVTYQWESGPSSTGPWANFGTSSATQTSPAITANTWFRCNVTCSGNTGTSNPVQVTLDYCSSTGTGGTYFLNNFTTSGGITNISNLNTGYSAGGYGNFTSLSCTQDVGSSITFTATPSSNPSIQIFVDWNQDLDFNDANEVVYTGGFLTSHTGTITVPAGTTAGNKRMRVVHDWFNNPPVGGACGASNPTYRETEDYTFTVTIPVPCTGTPAPGNTVSSASSATPGGTVNLSLQNTTTGTGVTYQWQSGPSSSGPWTNFGTSSATQTSPVITATTWFQCLVTCSGNTGTSNPVQVSFNPYCVPTMTFGCTDGDVIARVILNTLDNNSGTGCPSGTLGYSDYTSNPSLTTTLLPSSYYNCTVYAGQYNANYAAWIDYNDNNIFENSERIGYTLSTVTGSGQVGVLGSSANFPVTLACTPPPGPHRLRIREVYGLADGSTITPCGIASYGEIEDYTITIAAAPACPSPGLVTTVTSTTSSATITWATNCASGSQYDFEYGPAGFTQGTGTLLTNQTVSLSAPNASYTLTGLSSGTSYDVYYRLNCGGSGTSAWSIANTFATQVAPPSCATGLTATPTPGCGNYPVTLSWNAAAGATAYLVSLGTTPGGNQIANNQNIGNNTTVTFTDPTINTTYYWRVIPTNVAGNAVGCSEVSFTSGSTQCACIPDYTGYGFTPQDGNEGTVDGDMITNVTITLGGTTLLNNSSTSTPSTPQYTFYYSLPQINMVAANTYNVNVTAGQFTNQNFAVWIDYNDDNDFNDPGELIGFSSSPTTTAFQTISFPINLACNPPLGTHRMRIRDVYNTPGNTIDPCATYGWGETEDYLITIVPGAPFTPAFASTPTGPSCITAVTYTANPGQTNYSWSLSGTAGTDYIINSGGTSTSNSLNVTWLTPGNNTVTMDYSSPLGCSSAGAVTNIITIIPNAAVTSVTGASPLCINGTTTYTANAILSGGTGSWSSSDPAVATVNPSTGEVTGISLGTANIIYTVTGGCNGTASGSTIVTVAPCTYNWTGIVSTDWNTAGNWAGNTVPTTSDNAFIPNVSPNFFPVLIVPVTVNDLTIASGASVTVEPTAGLTLDGTMTNNGTFTLQSDASGTAWLDDFTLGGTVTGNIRVQRYVPIGVAGFRQLGTPVNMPNISGVQGFTPTGTAGFVIPLSTCNPDWVEWNSPYGKWMQLVENGPVQFNCYQSLYQVLTSGGMTKGRGYYMDVPGGTTLTFVGAPNTGPISDYTATHANGAVTNGWNIVSNPYPSPLRWSMADVPAGFDAIAQVWVTSGTYLGTFQPVDPNTPGQGIAIGQAFQLRVSNPGTSVPFSVSNANRTTAPPSFLFAGNDPMTLNIDMSKGGHADMTKIRFMDDATPSYDGMFDSYKVLGNATQPMVYSILNSVNMSINSYGNLTDVYTVPLGIKAGTAGEHTFVFGNMDQFPASTLIYLEDTETGMWQNMRVNDTYSFNAPQGTHNGRFLVHFYPPVETATQDALCEVPGSVTITSASPAAWTYTLTDAQSTTVSSGTLNNGSVTVSSVAAGDYELTLTEVQSGYSAVESVTVNGTAAVIAQAIASSVSVEEGQEIQFSANAQNADTYNWSFGDGMTSADVNPLHTYNMSGTYEVVLTASNSTNTCSAVSTLSVTVSEAATSSVEEAVTEEVKMWNVENTVFIRFGTEWSGKTMFTLYDAAGKRVMNKQLNNAQGTVTVDCGVLAAGTYTAELGNGKKVVTHKAIMGIK